MKNRMVYKDYFSSIYYSDDDNVFFGKIEGIQDSITFEGQTVDELRKAFEEAVEDYVEMCKELGKEPLKPYKGTFNVRVTPEIHKKLAIEAIETGKSLNAVVELALKEHLKCVK